MRKKKFKGDGIKLATLLYGPPKTKTTQYELPLGKAEGDDKKADQ